MPVLVGREKRTKTTLARVVPSKGGGVEWLVGRAVPSRLEKWVPTERSLSRVIKRAPSWMCLMMSANRRGRKSDSDVTLVDPNPKGESQSKCIAGRTVQDLGEGARTHKLDLEAKLKPIV